MEMRKCVNGHYYDASVNSECPYCKPGANAGKTVAFGVAQSSEDGDSKTIPMGYNMQQASSISQEVSEVTTARAAVDDDDGRTIAIVHKDMGIDPVVGWMICVSGKEKGRDYRIHSDNNYIGRSEKMDICVRGDETISRENHAIVSYDSIDKTYYFSPGEGRNIVRHNGKAIFQTVTLSAYDRVIVGKTELLFVPLCGEEFEWGSEDADI